MLRKTGFYVKDHGGVPTLFHDGAPFPAAAYMTYLEEYGCYEDFARAGYRLFSFPALFAGKWISATEGLTPFGKGIFDGETPDFSGFDASVAHILAVCPEAYLFPRVNLCMPSRWLLSHKTELDGTGRRESLFSEEWPAAAENMLRQLIRHVNAAPWRERIAGYHLAGGNTEEWFHFDLNGGLSDAAAKGFKAFLERRYPGTPFTGLPELSILNAPGPCHGSDYLAKYLEFANTAVAQSVARLARAAKDEAGDGVLVGAFYGYALEVSSPLWGTHALNTLLACDAVDFICSPCSYIGVRDPDFDWTEMYAADSVRLHGKLCLQECDIRTHLTRPLHERAPEYDPHGLLEAPIWHGLKNRETAVSMLRKAFSRQLIKGNGFWWFDMWGGWYRDPVLMAQMKRFREIFAASLNDPNRGSIAEVAVFSDESVFRYMTACGRRNTAHEQRGALGHMGAPYDICDIADFGAVYARYKAAVFLPGIDTPAVSEAKKTCESNGIPYLSCADRGTLFSAEELSAFCGNSGVFLYAAPGDIVYVNARFIAIYAVTGGEKTLCFPEPTALTDLLDPAPPLSGERISLAMRKGETKLFRRERL
jgi:beta-galactosidase